MNVRYRKLVLQCTWVKVRLIDLNQVTDCVECWGDGLCGREYHD